MAVKFFKCQTCSNVAVKMVDSTVPMFCCGKKMEELIPNTVDASGEKHVPVVTKLDGGKIKVEVGSVAHPMLPEHHIAFIYVETEKGGESWTVKKAERRRIDAFELWCWRRLLRVPWTARRSTSPF